jgi:DNA-binding transcriptional LysR family regulator
MDLRKLRHAVFVADWGNFTTAAARLHLSQPALSRSIQSLEDELGLKLFERVAAGVVSTAAGAAVIAEARGLLEQADGLKAHAQRLSRGEAGRVRVGVGPMFAGLLAGYLRHAWQPSQPVEVQVHILPVERLLGRLLADELDFFIADGRAARDHAAIAVEPIGEAPVGYHVRSGHALAERRRLSVAEIAAYPRASPNLPAAPLDIDEAVRASSRADAGRLYCEQLSTLIELTENSDAVLLALSAAVADEVEAGRLVTLDIPEIASWSAQIVIARRARLRATPTVERYAAAMADHVQRCWIRS